MSSGAVLLPREDEQSVIDLFEKLLKSWNERDFFAFSSLFSLHGTLIGFDGSQMIGPEEISGSLEAIFKNYETARYVWKVKDVRFLSPEISLLRAIAGMIPSGKMEIMPARNAIQTLTACRSAEGWKIETFQNTPAVFNGRPVVSMELTNELQELAKI